jgi:hypothetical protein
VYKTKEWKESCRGGLKSGESVGIKGGCCCAPRKTNRALLGFSSCLGLNTTTSALISSQKKASSTTKYLSSALRQLLACHKNKFC